MLVVAGAFALAALWMSRPDPVRIIQEAQKKLVHEAYFRAETDFALEGIFDRPELSFGDSRIALTGRTRTDADRTDPNAVRTASTFDFKLNESDEALVMKGESRRADGMHYLRLEEISDAMFPGIGTLEGQWVRSADPFLDLLIQPLEEDLVTSDLEPEEVAEMQDILASVPLFEYRDTLPSETVDGQKTYHFAVSIRQEALAAVMTRLKEFRTDIPPRPEDYALELAKVLSWGDGGGEVWIGKNDWKFRKLSFSTLLSEPTGGSRLSGQILLSRYGTPFDVDAPKAKDIEDVLARVISGRLLLAGDRVIEPRADENADAVAGLQRASAEETPPAESSGDAVSDAVDSDHDGLSDSEEFIYGSDPWNPDTDADGWSDGVEIANGKNPVGPGPLFGFGL